MTVVAAIPGLQSRGFNPTLQHVDVSGAHRFIASTASDQRGSCLGLNVATNHEYIARNEYTTLQKSVDASVKIFGAGVLNFSRPNIHD